MKNIISEKLFLLKRNTENLGNIIFFPNIFKLLLIANTYHKGDREMLYAKAKIQNLISFLWHCWSQQMWPQSSETDCKSHTLSSSNANLPLRTISSQVNSYRMKLNKLSINFEERNI